MRRGREQWVGVLTVLEQASEHRVVADYARANRV